MGRGDKRTKKGKTFRHSYGKTRPHDPEQERSGSREATKTPRARGPAAER